MKELEEMLNSSDKDCVYTAVNMIRYGNIKNSNKLLSKVSIVDKIKTYSDVCLELNIKELTIEDFNFLPQNHRNKTFRFHQIQNICQCFNEDWIPNWNDYNQYKYFPYFEKKASGWVVANGSHCHYSGTDADAVVGVYKNEQISNYCSKLFIDIYSSYLNS